MCPTMVKSMMPNSGTVMFDMMDGNANLNTCFIIAA